MNLELKQYKQPHGFNRSYTNPYTLGGVERITNDTEYGDGYFAITIFDRRIFITDIFEYVKDADTGKYFVKGGAWVATETDEKDGERNGKIDNETQTSPKRTVHRSFKN